MKQVELEKLKEKIKLIDKKLITIIKEINYSRKTYDRSEETIMELIRAIRDYHKLNFKLYQKNNKVVHISDDDYKKTVRELAHYEELINDYYDELRDLYDMFYRYEGLREDIITYNRGYIQKAAAKIYICMVKNIISIDYNEKLTIYDEDYGDYFAIGSKEEIIDKLSYIKTMIPYLFSTLKEIDENFTGKNPIVQQYGMEFFKEERRIDKDKDFQDQIMTILYKTEPKDMVKQLTEDFFTLDLMLDEDINFDLTENVRTSRVLRKH